MSTQKTRLKQIEEHLDQLWKLQKEYEDILIQTSDPKEKLRSRTEIDQTKSSIASLEAEKESLLSRTPLYEATEISQSGLARVITTRDGREMVLIPDREFSFGIEQVKTYVPAFYVDRYPVTCGEYQWYLIATGRPVPGDWLNGCVPPSKERHPIVNLTYSEALSYAQWANKRLPTEQEWEKAARGQDGRLWPWGHQFEPQRQNDMWRRSFEQRETTVVGSYSPQGDSPYKVADIGHLWEWTNSWYEPGQYRTVRGGSWRNTQAPPLIINRSFEDDRAHDVGFRCVCDADRMTDILASVLIE